MAVPWIQVYSNLPQHPKVSRLADELKITSSFVDANVIAAGMLVCLWTWAVQNAHDGDLSECSARTIASACKWQKKAETLRTALLHCGFIDEDGKLHDWEEYAGLLMEQEKNRRKSTRERVARYREQKKDECNADVTRYTDVTCNADVTVTSALRNASVTPLHNITKHNITNIISGGGDDTRACAREEAVENPLDEYCRSRGLCIDDYLGTSEEVKKAVSDIATGVIQKFAKRNATELDTIQAFFNITTWDGENRCIDADKRDLLLYAFECAAAAGHAGDWRYIDGVLRNLHARGIKTLSQAEEFDLERAT